MWNCTGCNREYYGDSSNDPQGVCAFCKRADTGKASQAYLDWWRNSGVTFNVPQAGWEGCKAVMLAKIDENVFDDIEGDDGCFLGISVKINIVNEIRKLVNSL